MQNVEKDKITLWDVETGRYLGNIYCSSSIDGLPETREIAFSSDGRWLAAASIDKSVKDKKGYRAPGKIFCYNVDAGFRESIAFSVDDRIHTLCFTPDNRHLIASNDRILCWEIDTQ